MGQLLNWATNVLVLASCFNTCKMCDDIIALSSEGDQQHRRIFKIVRQVRVAKSSKCIHLMNNSYSNSQTKYASEEKTADATQRNTTFTLRCMARGDTPCVNSILIYSTVWNASLHLVNFFHKCMYVHMNVCMCVHKYIEFTHINTLRHHGWRLVKLLFPACMHSNFM